MKGCFIAGVILLFVLGAVILNAVYVRNTADELLSSVRALPDVPDRLGTPAEIMAIRERLKQHAPILGITVPYATIDRVSEALINLEACSRADDRLQYTETLSLLYDLIEELARTEKISMENIL